MSDTEYRIWKALMVLARAGETSDPHVRHESYIEALWRFRSIDTGKHQREDQQ